MFNLTGTVLTCGRPTTFAGLIRSILPALVLVCLLGPSALHAQDDKLPKAEVILDKYVEVTGGKAAYGKLTNRVTKATFEMVGQGLKFSMTIYGARPDKMYAVMESEAFGKIEKGTDGKVAWEINVMTGPQIKEGEERALALRGATFDAVPDWRTLYKKAECVGVETVADKPCYKIVLTPKEGQPETRYYGKESNLLVKIELTLMLPTGTIPFESYASDYKRVDGILIPHKTRVMVMGLERIMTIESVKHNVKMPKDRFKLPEDIQTLVDKKKNEKSKPEKP